MGQNINQLFEQFLINNNCYSEFITNLLEKKQLTLNEYFSQNNSPSLLVLNAFP